METMMELVRDYCLDHKDENDINGCIRDFLYEISGDIQNWPEVPEDPEDEDLAGYTESIDLENVEIISIGEALEIFAGGDWQEPWYIKIEYKNDVYVCTDSRPMNETENFDGMGEDELAHVMDLNPEEFD